MADYKKIYRILLHAHSEVIKILEDAGQEVETIILDSDDPQVKFIKIVKEKEETPTI